MKTVVHITDLHFGKLTPGAMARLEHHLTAIRPDMCVVSGDLTMRSRHREWREAKAFLNRLPVATMVVPGNHDLPYFNLYERFSDPYRRFRKYINPDTDPEYVDDVMAIKGINTARSWVPHYTWKEGGISGAQIKAAAAFFSLPEAKDRFKIVFTHHPFLPPPGKPRTYLVRNAGAALDAFERAGVDLLLGGHLHLGYSDDITIFHTRIKRKIICIQGPTATSSRLRNREPNGFNLVTIRPNSMRVATRQWNGRDYVDLKTTNHHRTPSGWATGFGR